MKTLTPQESALIYNALLEKAVENRAAADRVGAENSVTRQLRRDADLCETLADDVLEG